MKSLIKIKNNCVLHNMHCIVTEKNYLKKNVTSCHVLFIHNNKKENFFKNTFQLLKKAVKIKAVFLNLTQFVLH